MFDIDDTFQGWCLLFIVIGAGLYSLIIMNRPIEGEIDEKSEGIGIGRYQFRIGENWYFCTEDEYNSIECQDVVKFLPTTIFHWRVRDLEIISDASGS